MNQPFANLQKSIIIFLKMYISDDHRTLYKGVICGQIYNTGTSLSKNAF